MKACYKNVKVVVQAIAELIIGLKSMEGPLNMGTNGDIIEDHNVMGTGHM